MKADLLENDVTPPERRSLGQTWTEVMADASGLVRGEAAMARAETSENLKSLGRSSAMMAAGAALLLLALIFLTVAAVVALAALIGLVWSLLAVGVVCVVIGGLLISGGLSRIADQNLLPERTLARISSDLRKLSARGTPVEPAVVTDVDGDGHARS